MNFQPKPVAHVVRGPYGRPSIGDRALIDSANAAYSRTLQWVNIHDGCRPTGTVRTMPNLLTVEGLRGNEHLPTPEHNCTLPFTRSGRRRSDLDYSF